MLSRVICNHEVKFWLLMHLHVSFKWCAYDFQCLMLQHLCFAHTSICIYLMMKDQALHKEKKIDIDLLIREKGDKLIFEMTVYAKRLASSDM